MPGRCAGCGLENKSCKVIKSHIMTCPDYKKLWQTDPDKALEPEDCFKQHKLEMDASKGDRREVRIAGLRVTDKARVAAQQKRYATRSAKSYAEPDPTDNIV
jgi:hypothetical protein